MIRMLIYASAFAVAAASVPVAYQTNPEAFEAAIRTVARFWSGGTEEPQIAFVTPAPALSSPEPLTGRKVRLDADGRGHFTGTFRLNGRSVDALVDTGATVVAINRSTARRVGLTLSPTDFIHEVRTANGTTRAAAAMIGEIEIGGLRARNVQAVVLDDAALAGTLVGMSFLNQLRRFEIRDGRLLMEQ